MATPMTPSQRLAAYQAEGITKIVEMPGWRDRCRCHNGSHERGERPSGRPWGPVHGALVHHTGSDTNNPAGYAAGILTNGYAGLPGPLCTDATAPDGTLYLVSSGRANHAGGGDADDAGDRNVLQSVIDEAAWLMQREAEPDDGNIGGSDGNDNFYGNEAMYSGGHAPTAAQLDTMIRWAAAICRFHGWSASSTIGHREWSKDKPDPGHVDMVTFRRAVQARLSATIGGASGAKPLAPDTSEEIDMDTAAALRAEIAQLRAVIDARTLKPVPSQTGDVSLHVAAGRGVSAYEQLGWIRPAITDLAAKLAELRDVPSDDVRQAIAEAGDALRRAADELGA